MKKLITVSLLIFLTGLGTTGCRSKPILSDVTLNWKPTDDIFELKKIDCELLRSKHIKLEKIIDTRNVDMKELIGANKENPARSLQVTTKSDVVDFIHSNLVKVFKEMYLDFDNQNADYSLTGEIKEFYAEENPGYAG